VPGWVKSLAGAAAFVNVRTHFGLACPSPRHASRRAAHVRDAAPCCSRSRSRSCARPREHDALTPACTPAARTPTRRLGWTFGPFFLRRASPPRIGRPRRHGLAVVGYLAHAVAGEEAPLPWSPSSRLATGRTSHARTCADRGRHARRHPWRRPRLRRVSRCDAPSAANT
jgi:hypothetical protein